MMDRIAIVGAGMTGLTAAHKLSVAGKEVRLFDKGRRRGGRIATRRTEHGVFNHGAPQIDVSEDAFGVFLNGLGSVEIGKGLHRGMPTMRSIFDPFASNLDIRQEVRIAKISKDHIGWVLRATDGRSFGHFDNVILTVPAPQAVDLVQDVDPVLADRLREVRMVPVWTCMVTFATRLSSSALSETGPIMRADRMDKDLEASNGLDSWVIHMTPEFTEENLNMDAAMVAPFILEVFSKEYRLHLPSVRYLNAHRWRYAFVDTPLGEPFLQSTVPGLWVGGDWTLGRHAQHAYRSGMAMAESLLSRMAETA